MITKFCDQISVAFVCHLRVIIQVRRYEIVDIYLGIFDGDAPYDSQLGGGGFIDIVNMNQRLLVEPALTSIAVR